MVTNIGVLGLGKMGEALVKGLQKAGGFSFVATTRSAESAADAAKRLGIECHVDNKKLATACKVIVLCVKPHQAPKVLEDIAGSLTKEHLVISVCASLSTD